MKYVCISKGERNLCGEICPHLFLPVFEVVSPSDFIFPSFILTKQTINPGYLSPKIEYHVNFELLALKLPTCIDLILKIHFFGKMLIFLLRQKFYWTRMG